MLQSQSFDFDCATEGSTLPPAVFSTTCAGSAPSSTPVTPPLQFLPDPSDPIKYVRLNLIFMERPGDAAAQIGGFHLNNPIHVQFWNDVLALANSKLANMHRQTAAGDCAGIVFDTRIRLLATMQNIEDAYYWNNQNGYGSMTNSLIADCYASDILCQYKPWYALPLHASLNNAVDACHKGINVVFTENQTQYDNANNGLPFDRCKISSAMLPGLPTATSPPNPDLRIHMVDQWLHYMEGIEAANASTTDNVIWNDNDYADENNPRTWIVRTKANLLLHELFHCFNLRHTNIDTLWPFVEIQCNIMCNVCSETSDISITDAQLSVVYQSFAAAKTRIYIEGCPYNPARPFVVNSNQTWQDDIRLYQDLVVQSGNTLTLKCKLQMPPDSRIVVERGAKLIIDGGSINKSDCDCGRWQGIEVWGNSLKLHADIFPFVTDPTTLTATDYEAAILNTDDPGMVILKNQARIEYARTAITTQRRGGYFPDYYGGIICAENSSFLNNRKAVELMQYKHQNMSRFNNCITTTQDHTIPFEGFTIWACTGITINQCQFNYNATQPAAYDQIGIAAWDANRLSIVNGCQFNNLKYGISLQATNYNLGNATITDNQFTNCRMGIQNLQTHSMFAQNNVFTHTSASAQHITLGGTCGYNIQNNTFNNGNGIVAFFTSQATPGNNLIECNTYNNCTIGNYIYDNNEGLQLTDNTFITSVADNLLQKGAANGSIAFSQGNLDAPHFNLFSTNPAPQHFKAPAGQTDLFVYFYHTDPLYTPEVNTRLVPKCDAASTCTPPNNFVNVLANPPVFTYTGCLDLNGDGIAGMGVPNPNDCQTKECYYAAKAYLDNLKNEIDGGDKADLLNSLYNSPEALATYQKYMAASPYLSDEVLIEAAKADLMSPNHRANILLSNAPLSNEAMYQIQDLVAPNIYQLLYTIKYYTKFSARDNLNLSISRESAKKEELLHNLLQKFADEKDYAQLDEILTAENTTYAIRALLSSKVQREHYTDAQAMLNYLPATNPDEQDYKTIQQINLQRLSATTNGFELNEEQYQQLRTIALVYGTQAPAACALLSLLRGEYCDWQIPPDVGSGKTDTHPRYKDVALLGKEVLNRLTVTPNPANSSINVALPTYLSEQPAVLNIYNLSGKLLKTLSIDKEQSTANIATTDLPNGIYLVSYIADGITVSSAKVVIQH